jgi:hypothetical protein
MFTAQQITDQNAINGLANEIEGHLLRILSPYQGLKVRKVSGHGGYVAKLQAEFDRYCADHGYNIAGYTQGQPYWLNIHASYTTLLAQVTNHSTTVKGVVIYLGGFDDQTGILTSLSEGTKRRTDYTLAEVEEALAKASKLEDEAHALRSSVSDLTRRLAKASKLEDEARALRSSASDLTGAD